MKSLYSFFLGVFLMSASAFAQESPDVLIKNVTDEVLTIVRQDKDIQGGNARKAIELVEVKVLPHLRCGATFTNIPVEIMIQHAQK